MTRATRGYSALAGMSIDGIMGYSITNASGVNAPKFIDMLGQAILPLLNPFPGPRSVVVMDNAIIHHNPWVRAMIEATGAILVFLRPYSYDLNPIELAFSKVKAYLERERGLCEGNPRLALARALSSVSADDAVGYFRNDGYWVDELLPGVYG